ncbi:hypothetical protein [Alkaliphilus hydrothermalis]|uniref:2TM domain-containing protein n=1 Tax=Alkaliphilus hydrothermalis TaxID=1482730 RepID=A0ABS2NSM3_9FIRM|nr:hypothetical protein [Alkaliphilus hydrothermalis]MBM7615959.1 hypothetical protein [Alkaliphilus hydrothermalis]
MDQERKEHILKSYSLGRKRYIFVHGVFNWGLSTALIYRAFILVATHGWSLGEVARGIFTWETLKAIGLFGWVGLLFGHFMWKWIEKQANAIQSEAASGIKKEARGLKGKNKKKQ